MLTVKSILIGALALGAVSIPTGVVVTDFGSGTIPDAPSRAVVVEAPDLVGVPAAFDEVFVAEVPLPPRPDPIEGVEEPRFDAPDIGLEDAVIGSVTLAPPPEIDLGRT